MPPLTHAEETDRILTTFGEDLPSIITLLERQFVVLHNRAQVLLTLCGIVISTTGFSGRVIAGTNRTAQILIIAGVALVLISAAVVVWGVLHLNWITMQRGETSRAWILGTLSYRDEKTRSYRVGIVLMLLGLALYVGAIAVMLTFPHDNALPAR